MRKYRPFLIYNPRLGWAFYLNHSVAPFTTKNVGTHRKTMRPRVGWFLDPEIAIQFEQAARNVR